MQQPLPQEFKRKEATAADKIVMMRIDFIDSEFRYPYCASHISTQEKSGLPHGKSALKISKR